MKRTKIVLLSLLATVVTVCSVMFFVACGEKAVPHVITWDYKSAEVTVVAEGYDTLPTTLNELDEVKFTVTPANGYNVSVSLSNGVSKDGDGYKLTVGTKDVTVRINTSKVLNDITISGFDANKQYFEDEKLDSSDLTVTANYVLGDEVVTNYTISYGENKGSAFTVGDTKFTVSFGGIDKELTVKPVKAPIALESAELVLENDTPVLLVKGEYNGEGDKEAAKASVEGYIHDACERGSWANKEFTPVATINDDMSFELRLTVHGMTSGHQYFFHVKDGTDNSNLACDVLNASAVIGNSNDNIYQGTTLDDTKAIVTSSGAMYYCGLCEDWNPDTIMIHMEDANQAKLVNVSLEVKDNKPYVVFNGTGAITQEKLLTELIIHLDLEDIKNGNVKPDGYAYVDEGAIVTKGADEADLAANRVIINIDEENKVFTVALLIEGTNVVDGAAFFAHLGAINSSNNYPNVSLSPADGAQPISANGLTFSFATAEDLGLTESWQSSLLYISVTAAE